MSAILAGVVAVVVVWAWIAPKELGRWAALAHKSYQKCMESPPEA